MPGGRNGEEGLPVGAGPGLPTVGGRAGDVVTYDFGVLTTGPVIDGARATLVVPQAGRLMATGEVCQQYRLLNGDGPSRPTSPNFRRRTGLLQRHGPMAWTCCGGSGSCGRSRWPGTAHPGRGTRLRLVVAGSGPTGSAVPASPGSGQVRRRCQCLVRRGPRAVGSGAQRDRVAQLLRVSPRRRQRADPEPLPAGPGQAGQARPSSPEPDGAG